MEFQPVTLAVAELFVAMDKSRADNARTLGRSPAELSALALIAMGDGATPSALSGRLKLTSGSVTALVDRLHDEGLVGREAHPTDRRSLIIVATPAGREIAERAARLLDDTLKVALDQISPEVLAETMKVFSLISEALETSSLGPA